MKFVLDTNVHIYFNLFTDCDWKTLLGDDNLTLLITPTILGEIDKLKNDPRGFVNRRARELGAKFDEMEEGKLTSSGIKVGFPEQSVKDFDWNSYNLDKSRSDDNIIAEILMIKKLCGDEICIVTEDSLLKRKARAHQIKFIPPPEDWRRDQKDPKDKKIRELEELIKKTIPEVKLCLRDNGYCLEKLEISFGVSVGTMLTDGMIEEMILELEQENIRKVEALRETLSWGHLFSKEKIDRYEKQLKSYLDSKRKHLSSYKHVQKERALIMEIPLVLKSLGNTPAEDIDVTIQIPQDIEILETLPEFPEEPKEPERPKTPSEEMDQAINLFHSYPYISAPDFERPHELTYRGPEINKMENQVSFWIKSLKHGFLFRLPLLARFRKDRPAHTFHIDYRIGISNHPKIIKGRLAIEILP
jgi:hypothetical protein